MGVWNLRTGETKMVPCLFTDYDINKCFFITLGFGFDEKRKEYKIVQIVHHYDPNPSHFAAYVYSLSSSSGNNCWRKVGEPKMLYHEGEGNGPNQVYSRSYKDGTFYWGFAGLIMSFDMSTEVFNPIFIPLPVSSSCIREICNLKEGSMLVISEVRRGYRASMKTVYEIWAMLEVGVTQSWTKLVVIDWADEGDVPFGIWRNEVILRSYGNSRLLIGDPFKRDSRKIHTDEPVSISRCLAWKKKK